VAHTAAVPTKVPRPTKRTNTIPLTASSPARIAASADRPYATGESIARVGFHRDGSEFPTETRAPRVLHTLHADAVGVVKRATAVVPEHE
jgi:hypothetical protein